MDGTLQSKQFIFGSIFLLANKLQLLGDKITQELTLKQWLLLNMLMHHSKRRPNFNEIAKMMSVSRQNVIKMIHLLEQKGFVELHESALDHRSMEVTLTTKTFAYFTQKQEIGNIFLNELFHFFSEEELNILKTLFIKLQQNIHRFSKEEEHG